jgi:hypothetical protein
MKLAIVILKVLIIKAKKVAPNAPHINANII